jgi:hypothetical protein
MYLMISDRNVDLIHSNFQMPFIKNKTIHSHKTHEMLCSTWTWKSKVPTILYFHFQKAIWLTINF